MTWLLKDFDLLSVVLHALTLALEALTLGGILFLLLVALPATRATEAEGAVEDSAVSRELLVRSRHAASLAASGLILAQIAATGLSIVILVGGSGFPIAQVLSANFFIAGLVIIGCSTGLAVILRSRLTLRHALLLCLPLGAGVLVASVAMSHAASRLEGRLLLSALTAGHHLGVAGWVGCMVFLLLALRRLPAASLVAQRLARRYSTLAMGSVALLVGAGVGLGYFYIGSWGGLYGTSYGLMVIAKTYLMLTMLLLGASNQRLLRQTAAGGGVLTRLRRFSEAEIGLGFTAILAAASLTSQAPAIDMAHEQLTGHEIVQRLRWEMPRLSSPPLSALVSPISLTAALPIEQYGSGTANDANERAWSEYNHHWAGLIVLAAGALALISRLVFSAARKGQTRSDAGSALLRNLAQAWPLLFLGLAVFILLRADPENWPLGPRPFWASFSRPDVLEHRLYAVLIAGFAFFEWSIERRTLRSPGAAYFFPAVCALGGAALLTHSHGLGSMHEEMLAELAHTPLALLGATAGWGRWIELRLPGTREARIASCVWPVCLVLVGFVLLDYRES